jgi:hypothetical protein
LGGERPFAATGQDDAIAPMPELPGLAWNMVIQPASEIMEKGLFARAVRIAGAKNAFPS